MSSSESSNRICDDFQIVVVVVCYKSEQWMNRCLDSLSRQELKPSCVYVIDNSSMSAESIEEFTSQYPLACYFSCRENRNYGGGNNIGINLGLAAGADAILVANPDTWFEDSALATMANHIVESRQYGVLAPLQLQYESDNLSKWASTIVPKATTLDIEDVPWLEGSCLLIRRDVLESVGGFDPLYEMYFEDNDYCRRVNLAGYRCGVVPSAKYHHHSNASFTSAISPARVARIDLSQFIFQLTDPEHGWWKNHARVLRWIFRRTGRWLLRKQPGFGHALVSIICAYCRHVKKWRRNWSRRRSGDYFSEIPSNQEVKQILAKS